jgi:hypothetical protein
MFCIHAFATPVEMFVPVAAALVSFGSVGLGADLPIFRLLEEFSSPPFIITKGKDDFSLVSAPQSRNIVSFEAECCRYSTHAFVFWRNSHDR